MAAGSDLPRQTLNTRAEAGWRVLVPLDETPQARRALDFAQALVTAPNGQVKLIRASGVEADAGYSGLAYYAEQLRDAGVRVEWSVVAGVDATTAILESAREWRPDLIVMATRKTSALDRWLNDSVTFAVVRSTDVPVLVVPPEWEGPLVRHASVRILVPLDGSALAEHALLPAARLAEAIPTAELILLRVARGDDTAARDYLARVATQVETIFDGRLVTPRVAGGNPTQAILDAAVEGKVDVIAMATRGHSGNARAVLGSTATAMLEQSTTPLLVLGPHALLEPTTGQIRLRARVRAADNQVVGEVHRVVVDLEQHAVVSVVVLGRGPLARDVLVPLEFIDHMEDGELELRLTSEALDQLPDFAYNEFVTPPPTWTSFVPQLEGPALVPVSQRKRIGPAQQELTPGTRVQALDGDIGPVDRVEFDGMGVLEAVWVRAAGVFPTDMRIPAEWVHRGPDQDSIQVNARRADIETYLGHESRSRLGH
jgi:nucleotide-binding universal stress UspA family protein